MSAYLLLMLIALFLGLISNTIQFKKIETILLWLLIIYLIVFASLRYEIGYDYVAYKTIFNNSPVLTEFTLQNSVEIGFSFLNSLVKTIGFDFQFVLFLCSTISMFFLAKVSKKYSSYPLLVVSVYVSRFYFVRDMGQIRSSIACLILVYSIKYIKEKNISKFIFFVCLASIFHTAALLFFVLYFFVNYVNFKNYRYMYIGLLVAFFMSKLSILTLFINFISSIFPSITSYVQSEYYRQSLFVINPIIFMQVIILLLLIKKSTKLKEYKYYDIVLKGYFMSTFLLILLSDYYTLAGRISTIFTTFEIIIIPLIFHASLKNNSEKSKYMKWFGIIGYICFVFLFVFIFKSSSQYIPYTTIFTK